MAQFIAEGIERKLQKVNSGHSKTLKTTFLFFKTDLIKILFYIKRSKVFMFTRIDKHFFILYYSCLLKNYGFPIKSKVMWKY